MVKQTDFDRYNEPVFIRSTLRNLSKSACLCAGTYFHSLSISSQSKLPMIFFKSIAAFYARLTQHSLIDNPQSQPPLLVSVLKPLIWFATHWCGVCKLKFNVKASLLQITSAQTEASFSVLVSPCCHPFNDTVLFLGRKETTVLLPA